MNKVRDKMMDSDGELNAFLIFYFYTQSNIMLFDFNARYI